jgi:uncharacterized membrane protein
VAFAQHYRQQLFCSFLLCVDLAKGWTFSFIVCWRFWVCRGLWVLCCYMVFYILSWRLYIEIWNIVFFGLFFCMLWFYA